MRCQNAARAGPFGGVIPVQLANTTTPAAARRALSVSMKRSEELLAKMLRIRQTISPEDDPEYLAELRADGEEV